MKSTAFLREEAEDSVAALTSRVEVLTKRKEKLEAALNQVQSKSNLGWKYFQMLLSLSILIKGRKLLDFITQADTELKAEQEREAKEEEEVAILEREVEANIAEVLIPDLIPSC